jgi:hypothetical protein
MQTFLSEQTLASSVQVLDNARLRKQFLEGWQILDAIAKTPEGGRQRVNGKFVFAANHPATNQWRGHERVLERYLWLCKYELDNRGESTLKVTAKLQDTMKANAYWNKPCFPDWYNDPVQKRRVRMTHRYNLYHKDPVHYAQYESEGRMLDSDILDLVCCPGKHARYYYPSHQENQ